MVHGGARVAAAIGFWAHKPADRRNQTGSDAKGPVVFLSDNGQMKPDAATRRRLVRTPKPGVAKTTPRVVVPDLSRYVSAPSAHGGLVSRQRSGSTSVSLCDLVWLGVDESDPPGGTENPRGGGSVPSPSDRTPKSRSGRGEGCNRVGSTTNPFRCFSLATLLPFVLKDSQALRPP